MAAPLPLLEFVLTHYRNFNPAQWLSPARDRRAPRLDRPARRWQRRAMRSLWLLLPLAGLAVSACGGDKCTPEEDTCVDDHTVRACLPSSGAYAVDKDFVTEACPGTFAANVHCVQVVPSASNNRHAAVCASTTSPSADCPDGQKYCQGHLAFQCVQGYAVQTNDCPGVCDGGECVY